LPGDAGLMRRRALRRRCWYFDSPDSTR
jgi:hypothetical protein